jgi:hypothetical protein
MDLDSVMHGLGFIYMWIYDPFYVDLNSFISLKLVDNPIVWTYDAVKVHVKLRNSP